MAPAFLSLFEEGNRLPRKGKSAVDNSRDPGALQYHSCRGRKASGSCRVSIVSCRLYEFLQQALQPHSIETSLTLTESLSISPVSEGIPICGRLHMRSPYLRSRLSDLGEPTGLGFGV